MIDNTNGSAQAVIRINQLHLRNFKGIERFDLVIDGEDVTIRGDNATGKTTLADAISWLLFGKDSTGRADFEIKTLKATGEAIHNLEHEVEAEITRGGSTTTLKKIYREKWTRKRGQASPEFTGHETEHLLDGVPLRKQDYTAFVDSIAPESLVRILTDPFHFAERMHWQDRRTTLLDVCGDVSDEDVIASDPSLSDLPGILGGRSMEDARKVIDAKRKKINDDLKAIPVRIDETKRNLPDVSGINETKTKKALADLREQRSESEQEKARITSGGEIAERKRELSEVRTRIQDIMRTASAQADEGLSGVREERNALRRKLEDAKVSLGGHESAGKRTQADIAELDRRLTTARDEWTAVSSETFEHEESDTCPACGQALPADQVDSAHQKALEEFNARKAKRLGELDEHGKRLKKERAALKEKEAMAVRAINKLEPEIAELEEQIAALDEQLNAPVEKVDVSKSKEYLDAQEELVAIEETIASLESDSTDAVNTVNQTISSLNDQIGQLEENLARLNSRSAGESRIAELETEERRLAGDFEELERQLYLFDEFLRRKVSLLTDRINSRFEIAQFKLFNELVNGGLEECCEVTVNGVPWKDVNHGSKINAGLDVINQLADHYGIAPPVIIDGAESVTSIISTTGQQIRLVVDANAPELLVETYELATTN